MKGIIYYKVFLKIVNFDKGCHMVVTVIILGNGHCDSGSNPGQVCLHFT